MGCLPSWLTVRQRVGKGSEGANLLKQDHIR
jgi:hypothetical protein